MRRVCASVLVVFTCAAFTGCARTQEPEPGLAGVLKSGDEKSPDARPTLVTFTKPGCPACLKLAPALAELQKEYAASIRFVEIDIAKAPDLILNYEITATPTLILFANDKETARLVNPPVPELRKALDAAAPARLPETTPPKGAGGV